VTSLEQIAPAFVEMAHSIVWASVATVDETRTAVWDKFANGPEPVGYDPRIIPVWRDGPTSEQFAALR
jgi:hypothetical protein